MKEKYVFKPYSQEFPKLFLNEKNRLVDALQETLLTIEHVGSTAIPGLGGKGIIDIAIAVSKHDFKKMPSILEKLGYIFREVHSSSERLFFRIDLSDSSEKIRRYHLHITFPGSVEWKNFLAFRDYLCAHPEAMQEYAELKETIAQSINEDGALYRELKAPFFSKILNTCD
ncbi:MAG: hypothetical protein S4CHLAM7_08430 [Chlamydiae bacterium]|nr:hypothetical protein [Chlamydiota bacterium]